MTTRVKAAVAAAAAALLALTVGSAGSAQAAPAASIGTYSIVPGLATYVTAGHNLFPAGVDDAVVNVTLPFPVILYGSQIRRSLWVSSNGNVQFGNFPSATWLNQCLPDSQLSGPAIAVFYDDLLMRPQATSGDGVFTATKGRAPHRSFVISWKGTTFNNPGGTLERAELIFYEGNRNFDIRYAAGDTSSTTIGIQNFFLTTWSQFTCNSGGQALQPGENLRFNYVP
jgi:hypothetical protein